MANKKQKKSGKSRRPSGFILVLIIIAVVGAGAGIAGAVITRGGGDGDGGGSSEIKLPDYAFSPQAPKGADKAYRFAVDYPEYLAAVPCYCGCGDMEGHQHNLHCFVKSRDGDDVEFDDHAFG